MARTRRRHHEATGSASGGPSPCKNRHVADLVHRYSHGLVRHRLGFGDLTDLCADLGHALQGARIAFIVRQSQKARQLHAVLTRQFGAVTLAFPDRCLNAGSRLTVATPYGLGHADVIADPIDVLVCLDAAEAAGEDGSMALAASGLARTRLFGLIHEDEHLPPRIRDLVMAAFGPDEVSVPRLGCQRRPIKVAWIAISGGPQVTSTSPAALHRQGLVCHPVRNRRIAALGRALVTGDEGVIRRICPDAIEAEKFDAEVPRRSS